MTVFCGIDWADREPAHDTVVLLASSGGTGVGVLLAASIHHGRTDRRLLRRLVDALMSGSGH
ncbi:hypothetical protein [Streptomyces mirabilis]